MHTNREVDKYGAPTPNANQKSEVTLRVSQRVAANIVKFGLTMEPVPTDPDEIGADPQHRGGAVPNIMVCHETLGNSFRDDGYAPTKPFAWLALVA